MAVIEHFSTNIDGVLLRVKADNGKVGEILAPTVEEAVKGVLEQVASFDSGEATLRHIRLVSSYLSMFSVELLKRGMIHDSSKLGAVEKPHFDRETQNLRNLKVNTPEYNESLMRLKVALDHHYANNSHHPEHHEHGVADMTLFDLVEMFVDWKAASERTAGQALDLESSFERFKFDPQLANIFRQTAKALAWKTLRDIQEGEPGNV